MAETNTDTGLPPAHHNPDGGSDVRHTPPGPAVGLRPGSPEHLAVLAQRTRTSGGHNGREWSITSSVDTDPNHFYPKVDCHIWGEFAGLAIEFGGYHDISAVDPYSGRRFWLSSAFIPDADLAASVEDAGMRQRLINSLSFYDAMRRLIDAMEAAEFGKAPTDTPDVDA